MAQTYVSQVNNSIGHTPSEFRERLDHVLRRLIDIFAAVVGLIFLSPVFLFFGLLVKRDSPGPAFYRGLRVGKDGKEFRILKFRTMYETEASRAGPSITPKGDSRVTPIGKWLRDTKINELPQLWNVLIGEMSLVGPRPEDPAYVSKWPEDLRKTLLSVRPGITSPASIVYRDEEKLLAGQDFLRDYFHEILPSKLRLDHLYIKNRTVLSDLDVIFLTALALLPALRRRKFPEHLLYWGPIARLFSRFGLWFLADLIIVLISTWITGLYWRMIGPLDVGVLESFGISFAIALLFSLTNLALGLNNITWAKARALDGIWVVLSGCIGTLLLEIFNILFLRHPFYPSGMILMAGLLATAGFGIARYRGRLVTALLDHMTKASHAAGWVGERVLIVGAGEMGSWAAWLITHGDLTGAFSIAGMVDDDPRKIGMVVGGVKILAGSEHIPDLVKKLDIGVIVYAITQIEPPERERILAICQAANVKLVIFPNLVDTLKASMLPEEEVLRAARRRNENSGVTKRADENGMESWIREMDSLLAAHDVYAARALLVDLKTQYNAQQEIPSRSTHDPHP